MSPEFNATALPLGPCGEGLGHPPAGPYPPAEGLELSRCWVGERKGGGKERRKEEKLER